MLMIDTATETFDIVQAYASRLAVHMAAFGTPDRCSATHGPGLQERQESSSCVNRSPGESIQLP